MLGAYQRLNPELDFFFFFAFPRTNGRMRRGSQITQNTPTVITGEVREATLNLTLALNLPGGGAATQMSGRRGDTEVERCRSFLVGGDDVDGLRERGGDALVEENAVDPVVTVALRLELCCLRRRSLAHSRQDGVECVVGDKVECG